MSYRVETRRTDSQRADVLHYKRQITRMAADTRYRRVAGYVNRREVIPEPKAFARKLGVPVYENVVTRNRVVGSRQMPFDEVLNDIHRQAGLYGRTRLLASGGADLASVSYAGRGGSWRLRDLTLLANPETRTEAAWLQ